MDPVTIATILGLLYGGASLGSNIIAKRGEQKLGMEQIRSQERMASNERKATEEATKKSRTSAEKYLKTLMEEKTKERISDKESLMLNSFLQSQDRQMALIMQAIQGASQSPYTSVSPGSSAGMTGLMRTGA
ncbi:MAG: hypothetical protein PVI43_00660 [Candidatus Bathyarchaeota archaeon]|jgi:hypothetical protein